MKSAARVLKAPLRAAMIHDDSNPSAAAPAREPSNQTSEEAPPRVAGPAASAPENLPGFPPAPQFDSSVPIDLRAPWGWLDVGLFVVFGVISSLVITWVLVLAAIAIFGANSNDFAGPSISTAKSVVLLINQALWDGCAILYLFVMLRARTPAPFWPEIGWRKLRLGVQTFRASAMQCLSGGAMLALVVSFASGFLNPQSRLPIEQILQARISVALFAVLGVLVAPLVEETIFRGFLYPVIARRLGIAAGVIVTGILFGSMHAAQLWGGWGQIALLILVGIVLTWVRARTGTVAASYFVHLGYNGLQLLGYLVYTMGGARH
ncbi:MAG: CPBP family intramembrane metalloprotease [Acidobacteriia bacterium]|nr:CPBP family intramembrane metalloprotease [Terriglobia bacterium]